jgi:hypothetical protein
MLTYAAYVCRCMQTHAAYVIWRMQTHAAYVCWRMLTYASVRRGGVPAKKRHAGLWLMPRRQKHRYMKHRSIRQHTVSIRQHTSAYVGMLACDSCPDGKNTGVYPCISLYIYIKHRYTPIYICIYLHVCIDINILYSAYVYIYIYVYIYVHVYTYTFVCVCIYIDWGALYVRGGERYTIPLPLRVHYI